MAHNFIVQYFYNVMRYNSYATAVQAQRVLHFSASFIQCYKHFDHNLGSTFVGRIF